MYKLYEKAPCSPQGAHPLLGRDYNTHSNNCHKSQKLNRPARGEEVKFCGKSKPAGVESAGPNVGRTLEKSDEGKVGSRRLGEGQCGENGWTADTEFVEDKAERWGCPGSIQGGVTGPIQLEPGRTGEGFS